MESTTENEREEAVVNKTIILPVWEGRGEIRTDLGGHFQICILVNVDVTNALRMAEHGDSFRLILNAADHFTGPSGNHQVNITF